MIQRILFAAIVATAFAMPVPAKAATYNVSFDGAIFDVVAQITTDGSDNVIAISGSVAGPNGAAITALQPLGNPSWIYDNKFFASSPYVNNGGILFSAGLYLYNLYSIDGPVHFLSTFNSGIYNPGDIGILAVAQTPLPAAIWLFGTVLVSGMGLLARRRRRSAAQLTNAAFA